MRALVGSLVAALALGASSASAAVLMRDGSGRVEVVPDGKSRGLGILPGEPLGPGTLSVGADSAATFQTDDGATLDLSANTRARVNPGETTHVLLEAGKLSAAGGSHKVSISLASGLAASATGSKFVLALAADGSVAIESQQGPVELQLDGRKLELASGKSLQLAKGQPLPGSKKAASAPAPVAAEPVAAPVAAAAPTPTPAPTPAPAPEKPAEPKKPAPTQVAMAEPKPEAPAKPAPEPKPAPAPTPAPTPAPAAPPTLNVKWPAGTVPLSYTVRGKVSPGASVTVNNVSAEVRKSGSFSAKIELPDGPSVVEVKATGADGQAITQKREITAAEPPAKPPPSEEAEEAPTPPKAKPAGNAAKPQVKQEAAGWE